MSSIRYFRRTRTPRRSSSGSPERRRSVPRDWQRGVNVVIRRPSLDGFSELSRPALELVGRDARDVHRFLFAEEIVERDADEARRSPLEEGVDRGAHLGRFRFAARLRKHSFAREPAEQFPLLAAPVFPRPPRLLVRRDEADLALD